MFAQGPAPHFVTFQIGAYRVDQVVKGQSSAPVRGISVTVDASLVAARKGLMVRVGRGGEQRVELGRNRAGVAFAELRGGASR